MPMKLDENGHPTIDEQPTDEMLLAGAKAFVDQVYYKANTWDRGYVEEDNKQDWLKGVKHAWKAMEAVRRASAPVQADPVPPEKGWIKPALDKAEQRASEMPEWMRRSPAQEPVAWPTEATCPFCHCDPFEYVDNGVGMEPVAVTCCKLGDLYFRGARPDPEDVSISWEDFRSIGDRLASPRPTVGREEIKSAIRTFCESLGQGSVVRSHGVERIYYSGISLDALTAAVMLALTGEHGSLVSKTSYCVFCDLEHQLHEDERGFYHVIKGERRACANSFAKGTSK